MTGRYAAIHNYNVGNALANQLVTARSFSAACILYTVCSVCLGNKIFSEFGKSQAIYQSFLAIFTFSIQLYIHPVASQLPVYWH